MPSAVLLYCTNADYGTIFALFIVLEIAEVCEMKNSKMEAFLDDFMNFTEEDKTELVNMIMKRMKMSPAEPHKDNCNDMLKSINENERPDCPFCHARAEDGKILKCGKHGKNKDVQRYQCKDCKGKFTNTTGTGFARSRKLADTWRKFIGLTLMGRSLKVCERECGICHQTAVTWRHKMLKVLMMSHDDVKMAGIIEIDDMVVGDNYKGNHYPGFHVAGESHKDEQTPIPRGFAIRTDQDRKSRSPKNKLCVICMVQNGSETLFAKAVGTGAVSAEKYDATLKAYTNKEFVKILSDKQPTITKYLKENEYDHTLLLSNTTGNKTIHRPEIQGEDREIHLQHVNAFHRNLRSFLASYRGVTSKYLNHYLALFVWMSKIRDEKQKRQESLSIEKMAKRGSYITRQSLHSYPAIPDQQVA